MDFSCYGSCTLAIRERKTSGLGLAATRSMFGSEFGIGFGVRFRGWDLGTGLRDEVSGSDYVQQ